ncbi:MAG: YidB family protein [Neisseriaceae bacterium]|nr:YidB family protein [Neisseriaceae bacterium]
MSFLNSILGAALGSNQGENSIQQTLLKAVLGQETDKQEGNTQGALLQAVMSLITNQNAVGGLSGMLGGLLNGQQSNGQSTEGLGGLTNLLSQMGLSDQVNSWIGTGENQPINADDIHKTLGNNGVLGNLASQANISETEAANGLAQILPQLVNKLTPNGKIDATDIGSILSQFLSDKK